MPLTIPSARDIENRIHFRLAGGIVPLTDLTLIAVLRQLVRAAFVEEFASLWAGIARALDQWYVATATGADLRRRLLDFDTPIPDPQNAYGRVVITASAPIDVPPGFIVRTNPQDGVTEAKRYTVRRNDSPDLTVGDLGDGSWHVDPSRAIDIVAVDPGAAGNAPSGTINAAEAPLPNLTAVSNPAPLSNGFDSPPDDALRQLFRDYLKSLAGSTRGAVLFQVLNFVDATTGRRASSAALEEWGGQDLLDNPSAAAPRRVALKIYVDEGNGAVATGSATATAPLVAALQRLVDGTDLDTDPGVRPAGTPTAVVAARALAIDVAVIVDIDASTTSALAIQEVRDAVAIYFAGLPVAGRTIAGDFQGQFSLPRLFRAVEDVPGVLRATFLRPTSDRNVPIGYKAIVGDLAVTANPVP